MPASDDRPDMTVLMPVFNGGAHLAEAVHSVLNQTYGAFELLVIDDGSTDGSSEWLDSLTDPRVRVVHQRNTGLVGALNRGLAEATHELVARMDADDISRPERLARQRAYLLAHPQVAAVGSCFDVVGEDGTVRGEVHTAAAPAYLHRQLYFRNTLPHGGVTFRRSAVIAAGGYRDVGPVEDYDLWARLAQVHELASLPERLFVYRVTPSGISVSARDRQLQCLTAIRSALHTAHPLTTPSPITIAAQGSQHVSTFGPGCRGAAQWYCFDHAWLAVTLARQGRGRSAATMAVGLLLFLGRHPSAVRGLPPLQRLSGLARPLLNRFLSMRNRLGNGRTN